MKKTISFVLAICLLLTAIVLPASALTAADFTDVPAGAWYYNAVNYCLENGLMSGMGKGVFSPNGTVTRSQITQVIYNREGSAPVDLSLNKFSDVGEKQWFARGVVWCNLNGIVSGNSSTTFNPNGQVTRGDLCLMLYNYVKKFKKMDCPQYTDDEMDAKFVDWSVISWDKDALRWATRVGLVSGTGTDKATGKVILNPKGTANRAQLAQYLKNLNEKVFTEETPDPEKCPHGNDPETCPVCHPAEPTETPKPTPEPTPEPTPVPDKPMYTDDPAPETRLAGERDAAGKALAGYVDPRYQGAFDGTDPDYEIYRDMDFGTPRSASEGADYTSLVPVGGYVDGASHPIGWFTDKVTYQKTDIVKADYGTRYNKYGVDVSSVDGLQSDVDHQVAFYIHSRMGWGGSQDLSKAHDGVDTAFQLCAEAINCDAAYNLDNLTRAGLSLQVAKEDSTRYNTFELSVLTGSPEVSKKLRDLSETCTSRDELISALCAEYGVSSWQDIPGLCDDRINEICDGEWYVDSRYHDGARLFFATATVTFDHTPTAGEVMQQLDVAKDGTMNGYFMSAQDNVIFAVAVDEVNNIATYIQVCDRGNMANIAQMTDAQWARFMEKCERT